MLNKCYAFFSSRGHPTFSNFSYLKECIFFSLPWKLLLTQRFFFFFSPPESFQANLNTFGLSFGARILTTHLLPYMLEEYTCVYIALNLKLYRDTADIWIYDAAVGCRKKHAFLNSFLPQGTALEASHPHSHTSSSLDKRGHSHSL